MRKLSALILSVALLASNLSVLSYANTLPSLDKANTLFKLGIIAGSDGDLKLNKTLTRAEAATLIVKLTGAEASIKANPALYNKPVFKDVKAGEWYTSYIAYCYEKGIVAGVGNDLFTPNAALSEKAFLTMLLKAMDYTKDDFNWDNVFQKALQYGLVSDSQYATKTDDNTQYLRLNVFDAFYNALVTDVKNSEQSPIEKLIAKGIIKEQDALSTGIVKQDVLKTEIKTVVSVNEKTVEITLNESIKTIDLGQVSVMQGSNAVQVDAIAVSNEKVTLTLNKVTSDTEYTVKLTNVSDVEGHKIAELSAKFNGYKPIEVTSNYFKISKITPISKNRIDVAFTQPISIGTEMQMFYSIQSEGKTVVTGSFNTMAIAKQMDKANVITIWTKDYNFNEGQPYTLAITGDISSLYGVKLKDGNGDKMNFVGVGKENTGIQISDISPVDNNMIKVTFTKDVDIVTAENTLNYTLVNNSNKVPSPILKAKVVNESNGNKSILIRTTNLNVKQEYILTIKDVKDRLKVTSISEEKLPLMLVETINNPLKIDAIAPINKGTILVYFNKPVDDSVMTANIVLNNGLIVQSKSFNYSNPYELKVFLRDTTQMTASTSYTLSVLNGLTDMGGNTQVGTITANFNGSGDQSETVYPTSAKLIANNAVLVTFSHDVNTSSNPAMKYTLEYKEGSDNKVKTATNVSYIDTKTAVLIFDGFSKTTNYTLKLSNIVDYSGQYTTTTNTLSIVVE